jgi:hypothetical protein
MSVRSVENRREIEKLCAAGGSEEVRYYLVIVRVL